jgi:transcriptional regulator with XRE-family HTH domain
MTFTERLDELMAERGLNKSRLADATNIKYHRLNQWWRSETLPNASDAQILSEFFDKPIEYLLYGKESSISIDRKEAIADRLSKLDADGIDDVEKYVDFLLSRQNSE